MPSESEIFNAQFVLRKKVIPDDVLEEEFKTLELGLRMARFKGNRVGEMEVLGPGVALSLIREVQMLRAFRDQVTALSDACEEAAPEDKPGQAAMAAVGILEATKKLSALYWKFGQDLEKLDEEEAKREKEKAPGMVLVLGDGQAP